MKKIFTKISIILFLLALLNLPLFFLLTNDRITYEQPDNAGWLENINNTSEQREVFKFSEKITTQHNNFAGVSAIIYSNKFFNSANIGLKIYEYEKFNKDDPNNLILEKEYEKSLNYHQNILVLNFEPIKDSEDKKFTVVLESKDKEKDYVFAVATPNDRNDIFFRPLYQSDNTAQTLYYRLSQYKPGYLKNPVLLIAYVAFNILFGIFLWFFVGSVKKREKGEQEETFELTRYKHIF